MRDFGVLVFFCGVLFFLLNGLHLRSLPPIGSDSGDLHIFSWVRSYSDLVFDSTTKTYTPPFRNSQNGLLYGSQGHAVQVGSELLVRLPKPISVPQRNPASFKRRSYKLSPRTIEVIEQLSETDYNNQGQVLAASMKVLKVKKLNAKYLADSDH